jgi:PAS domain S-box-containing protein
VIGLPLRIVMPREDPVNLELSRQFIRSGYRLVDAESREVGDDGRELIFLNNMVGIVENGKLIGEWGTNRDITERQRSEETLRESEERYRSIVNQTIAGIAETDLTGMFKMVNDRYCEMTGYARENLLNDMRMQDVTHVDDLLRNTELFMRLVADGTPFEIEKRYIRRDGSSLWVHNSVSAILDANGKPKSAVAIVIDINDRKQAEKNLRESEERFRAILRQATAGIVRKDAEGRLVFVNEAFCNMLGYTDVEMLGKTVWEFMHPDDVAKNKHSYERLVHEGVPFKLERRFLRKDGSVIWVDASVSPIVDALGKSQSAVAVEVDITGRKEAEQALQELNLQLEQRVRSRTAKLQTSNQALREEIEERQRAEELLRRWAHIFENADWGIATVNQDTFTMVNPTYAKMHGYSPEELLGRSIYEVYAPDAHAHARKQIRIAYERGHHIYESRHARKDGSIFPVLIDTTVVRDQEGNVLYRAVNAQDITERKRVEQELNESRERLQVLSRRLVEVQEDERRAIARELHDRVGQTLAALNINLIIMNGQLLEDSKERIGSRLEDSLHLVAETIALVRNVMTDLRPAVLDDYGLEAALQSYIDEYQSRYAIGVFFHPSDTPIPRLDPGLEMTLLRIAQEALTNIFRHAQAKQVHVSLQLAEQAVHLTVQDDGIGIQSMEEAHHLKSHGLKIMQERAQAFGGSVNIESEPGKGTKVEARIPIESGGHDQVQKEMQ